MFNSTVPAVIGPVRSVRAEDPDIVWPLGGVFAYSGGAQVNVDAINSAPVKAVDESSAGDAMVRNASGQPPRDDHPPIELAERGGVEIVRNGTYDGAVWSHDPPGLRAAPVRGRLRVRFGHG